MGRTLKREYRSERLLWGQDTGSMPKGVDDV